MCTHTCVTGFGQRAHMQTKNTHNPQGRQPNKHTQNPHTLACTHLTLIETTGWQFYPLTGSIRGQSAAEPHGRDTLDYRETARRTIEDGWGRVVLGPGMGG